MEFIEAISISSMITETVFFVCQILDPTTVHCICPVAYSEELRICRESHSVNKKMHFLDFVEVLRAALQGSINKLVSKTVEDINVFVA